MFTTMLFCGRLEVRDRCRRAGGGGERVQVMEGARAGGGGCRLQTQSSVGFGARAFRPDRADGGNGNTYCTLLLCWNAHGNNERLATCAMLAMPALLPSCRPAAAQTARCTDACTATAAARGPPGLPHHTRQNNTTENKTGTCCDSRMCSTPPPPFPEAPMLLITRSAAACYEATAAPALGRRAHRPSWRQPQQPARPPTAVSSPAPGREPCASAPRVAPLRGQRLASRQHLAAGGT